MEHRIIKNLLRSIPFAAVVLSLMPGGCYYDNEEYLYPEGSQQCDTVNVTYSQTIWPVINDNCITCHSGTAPSGNILLDNYSNISAHAQIPAGQPGSLYGAVSHDPGNSAMPKSGAKLSDCRITQIRIWIESGTPNN